MLGRNHQARWLEGKADSAADQEERGRALAAQEIATLEFAHMATFYGVAIEPEEQKEADRNAA